MSKFEKNAKAQINRCFRELIENDVQKFFLFEKFECKKPAPKQGRFLEDRTFRILEIDLKADSEDHEVFHAIVFTWFRNDFPAKQIIR